MPRSTVTDSEANTPESKLTELEMTLRTEGNKDKCIVMVEGPDDRKFYLRFVDDACVVVKAMKGCAHLPQIIALLENGHPLKDRIIGIKDADFDHVLGVNYGLDNLFVTDTHDWETMAMVDHCEEQVSIEALDRREAGLFNTVMRDIINYSFLKLYNSVEICGNNLDGVLFEGLKLFGVYNGNDSIRLDDCLEKVKNHGNNARLVHFPQEQDIERFKQRYPDIDLLQLSCGHDVIHCLIYKLRSVLDRSPEIGYSNIERLLRVSYPLEIFKTTQLYQKVADWSDEHDRTIWAA